MITTVLLAAACLSRQGDALYSEMKRAFKGLVEISAPSTLPQIRAALQSPLTPSHQETLGRSWFRIGAGWADVIYTERGDFRGYACMKVPHELRLRSDLDLRNEALQVVDLVGFWGETCSTQLSRQGALGAKVTVSAHFGDMTSTHGARIEFAPGSLALEAVFMWDRLDYARFRNAPRAPRTAALQAAIEAYESFAPYPVAQVGAVRPFFGIPASAELRPPTWHEMNEETLALCRQYVALPLYYVDFTNVSGSPSSTGESQTVVIDARTGKAIVLYPFSGRGGTTAHLKAPPLPKSIVVGLSSGVGRTLSQVASKDVSGKPVCLGSGLYRYMARYDARRHLLFLPEAEAWSAYRVPETDIVFQAELELWRPARKPFGGGPSKKPSD